MELHILFVLGVFLVAYVAMGGMVFQRLEEDKPEFQAGSQFHIHPLHRFEEMGTLNISARSIAQALVHQNLDFEECYFSENEIEKAIMEIAMIVARFVIENVSSRNVRNYTIFNFTMDDRGENMVIIKEPPLVHDWDFYGSVFFAATTITTIGYGHICPKTELGKLAVVAYALIGVCFFYHPHDPP